MSKNPNASAGAKRVIQVLVGTAVLIVLAGGSGVYLLNTQVVAQQQVADAQAQKVGSDEEIARRYQQTRDDYDQTMSRIKFLESSVSAKSYVPTLLGQLQNLATQTHLTMNSVRPVAVSPPAPPAKAASSDDGASAPAKKAPPPPYDLLNVDLNVTGTYTNTVAFLYGLTRFPKIISVSTLTLQPGGSSDPKNPKSEPTMTTNLHLTAFIFHDDAEAPAGTVGVAAVPPSGMAVGSVVPTTAPATVAGASGRATQGAVGATRAANDRSRAAISTL